jgi:hypothetical protein
MTADETREAALRELERGREIIERAERALAELADDGGQLTLSGLESSADAAAEWEIDARMAQAAASEAGLLQAFGVWAEMHDGATRRLTVHGYGVTYQQRLTDAKEQALRHPELKGAKLVVIR